MSKKKSLGSSPIGLKSKGSTMGFIPDLGVSGSKENATKSSALSVKERKKEESNSENKGKQEKKVVSYNLEVDLIDKIKSIANNKDMYYSSLVSLALKRWISQNK